MAIKVVLAKSHHMQLEDAEIRKELSSVETEVNRVELPFQEGTINYVFLKGIYVHNERKMITACLFLNKMNQPITELHGVLNLKFKTRKALIAKTTINFDEPFIGLLNPGEGLLVHLGVPVKGLSCDENFTISDISGVFEDVRVTIN